MSEESNSIFPEFDAISLLQQRLAQKNSKTSSTGNSSTNGNFDPYKMMVNRKQKNEELSDPNIPIQTWQSEDIKKLEEFCSQHGIIGFNCGRMSPLAALAFLKQKLGIVDISTKTEGYGPNYPYTMAMQKKQILHG